jgi:hypothetical protein
MRVKTGSLMMLAAMATIVVGCESSSEKKETFHHAGNEKFWQEEHEPRIVRSTVEHQAMLGAQADPTLYACHFDGANLNALGRAKVDALIGEGGGASKIYIDSGKTNADAHRAAVNAHLAAANRADGSIALESGAAPGVVAPAAPSMSRMYKTENPEHSTSSNESSATNAGSGMQSN